MTILKGMTWSHPRGRDPLIALSDVWMKREGVVIEWDARSLQDFESHPVEALAKAYDLIIIDHPHVGKITAEKCLTPLPHAPEIEQGSLGRSFESYHWEGKQWAWPVDAAAQVQAIRPDLTEPLTHWDEAIRLAREGRVMIPLRPPHILMSFYTLSANVGRPCGISANQSFADRASGIKVLELLAAVADAVDPVCLNMDPIAVLEAMAEGGDIACSPLIYGYISYSIQDLRTHRIAFHDIPEAALGAGPRGSTLGGTGIALSAFSNSQEAAIAFARYAAGPQAQAGLWTTSGGQAGHRSAWTDAGADAASGRFYSCTLATLDRAWMRPRHNGYMAFQENASMRLHAALKDGRYSQALDDLDVMFAASF